MRKLFFCFLGKGAMGTGPASQKDSWRLKNLKFLLLRNTGTRNLSLCPTGGKGNVWDGELFYGAVKGNHDE
jgi:hypothetical protein